MRMTTAMRCLRQLAIFSLGSSLATAALAQISTDKVHVDIPAQNLSSALTQFGRDTGTEIVFTPEAVSHKTSSSIKGDWDRAKALLLLLSGTGLTYRITAQGAIVIDVTNPPKISDAGSAAPDTRLAQSNPSAAQSSSSPYVSQNANKSELISNDGKRPGFDEIVVTGSRLNRSSRETSQEIQTYTKDDIRKSGRTTIADFLNTLGVVSVSIGENAQQTFGGATSVQLHGLPLGTTLVLINGRRVETSGAQGFSDFFDLNNIPLAVVERIEVLPTGASAVYGSDAIAGVVNIILRKSFKGAQADIKYGRAVATDETDANIALGNEWDRASVSLTGMFQSRNGLLGSDRALTSGSDYRSFGGTNKSAFACDSANVYSPNGLTPLPGLGTATFAAAPKNSTGVLTASDFAPGVLNQCGRFATSSIITDARRAGLLLQGSAYVAPFAEIYTEVIYSHVRGETANVTQGLPVSGSRPSYTLSAANPYNPFGVNVGVSVAFPSAGREHDVSTDFFRPLLGIRGELFDTWKWDWATWYSTDHSAETAVNANANSSAIRAALSASSASAALNPFDDSSASSQRLIQAFFSNQYNTYSSGLISTAASAHGTVLKLPTGPIEVALGSEYDRGHISENAPGSTVSGRRSSYALFGEMRVPVIKGDATRQSGDVLDLSGAYRYDHYSDFGGKGTPQFGANLRPIDSLLLRATYGKTFKAPPLTDLTLSTSTFPGIPVIDPRNGQSDSVDFIFGGNPNLKASTGQSKSLGLVYVNPQMPNLRLAVTNWQVDLQNSVQLFSLPNIVNNETLFPGAVVRSPVDGRITAVYDVYFNFGEIKVKGIDYDLSYKINSDVGLLTPSLSATETYHFTGALFPGLPPTDRTSKASDDTIWAPRWKGTAAVTWELGPLTAHIDGRYVGRYQDYDSTREIGNFWLFDANFRFAIGESLASNHPLLRSSYIELGRVNLFNKLPTFSNYASGTVGYDPAEYDVRGGFTYAQIGVRW
jgi:iron complex outermembrane receptor protein